MKCTVHIQRRIDSTYYRYRPLRKLPVLCMPCCGAKQRITRQVLLLASSLLELDGGCRRREPREANPTSPSVERRRAGRVPGGLGRHPIEWRPMATAERLHGSTHHPSTQNTPCFCEPCVAGSPSLASSKFC